jgi:putative ABC transport system substrate-binding protein
MANALFNLREYFHRFGTHTRGILKLCMYALLLMHGFKACAQDLKNVEKKSAQPMEIKRVGIVSPMEHAALNEIVEHFIAGVKDQENIKLTYKNAQGDMNLMNTIIQQYKEQDMDYIATIGTLARRMAMQRITNKPLISMAALPDNGGVNPKQQSCYTRDAPSVYYYSEFLSKILSKGMRVLIIHSNDPVSEEMSKSIFKAASLSGFVADTFAVQNMADLYNLTAAKLPGNFDVIIFPKDNLLASGVSSLVKLAKKHKVPLIASDEHSVRQGADLAVGYEEKQIGQAAAGQLIHLINEKTCGQEEIYPTPLHLFVNKKSCLKFDENKFIGTDFVIQVLE